MGSEYFITDKGVSQLYEMLKDMNFARISRSVIINFENVNTIGDEIIMTDGVKLKSSRRMKKTNTRRFFLIICVKWQGLKEQIDDFRINII